MGDCSVFIILRSYANRTGACCARSWSLRDRESGLVLGYQTHEIFLGQFHLLAADLMTLQSISMLF